MAGMHNVGFIIGSLSEQSINRRLAGAIQDVAGDRMNFTEIPIADLPVYNRDLDGDLPAAARRLKEQIEAADAVLFITPEYNRSVPAALNNAIEWASRPFGQNSLTGKPTAVCGASPGAVGTAVAQQDLRSMLTYSASPQMLAPEMYFQFSDDAIDEDGTIQDGEVREVVGEFVDAFADFLGQQQAA